jgi:hypothetical protein
MPIIYNLKWETTCQTKAVKEALQASAHNLVGESKAARRRPAEGAPKFMKKKKKKGMETAIKLPNITPVTKCRLKCLKMERVRDYLLMEEVVRG